MTDDTKEILEASDIPIPVEGNTLMDTPSINCPSCKDGKVWYNHSTGRVRCDNPTCAWREYGILWIMHRIEFLGQSLAKLITLLSTEDNDPPSCYKEKP